MSSKLGDGLWEAKFILPEHREAIKSRRLEEKRKAWPVLDDQEIEILQQIFTKSYNEHRKITIRLFGEFDYREVTGGVTAVQTYATR
ncbi:hypothetical protein FHR92_001544 [Fontibacillus solani]|uniref:Uncharacterized protein n=1 Tax=Fontibacillus solani TaxID=1572857 RepID=A0A7W3XQX9_9BACL|nr:YolD-like family protein [Fontibacillus solani]MBA9085082.1 hypothetical protein [Fontibacillus solani]